MKRIIVLVFLSLFVFLSTSLTSITEGNDFSIEVKQVSLSTPGPLALNQKVYVLFNYQIPENYKEGVYLIAIPKGAKPTLVRMNHVSFDIQPAPLVKSKKGTITRYFSIIDGNSRIKNILIRILNKKKHRILAQKSIAVNYLVHPKSIMDPSRTNYGTR